MFCESDKEDIDELYQNRKEAMTSVEQYKRSFVDWRTCGAEPYQLKKGYSVLLDNLFFLNRVEPFTSAFIATNGIPDANRAVYCLKGLFSLVNSDMSNSEVVPELFFMPEIFQNRNCLHAGLHQAEQMGDQHKHLHTDELRMPPWAANAYDLCRVHREELESKYVKENILKWIDLIFGVDQKNDKKYNLFFATSYPEWHKDNKIEKILAEVPEYEDPLEFQKNIIQCMGDHYIMPTKLFQVNLEQLAQKNRRRMD